MNETLAAVIVALLLVNLVGLLAVGLSIGRQGAEGRILEGRLTKLEARVDNLPTHRDLTELRGSLTEVVETVATIAGQAQTMTQMLRTIQQHLLENDR